MKPLKNFILVGEAAAEQTTESGLILTGNLDKGSKPGIVLAVGPDVLAVGEGDKIALKWGEGLPVTVDGKGGVLISEDAVYAIYSDGPDKPVAPSYY